MDLKYINIYNNLVNLTRNKDLYKNHSNQDTFSDRLIFFLLHFSFFLKNFKSDENRKVLQEIYDYIFRQLDLSIREIGYGDQTINKKMKIYLNLFHEMIDKLDSWEKKSITEKRSTLQHFINNAVDDDYFVNYFEIYRLDLSNNTLNYQIKSVVR